jgi:hypothetical protein
MGRERVGLVVTLLLVSCGPAQRGPPARTIVDHLERALEQERANTVLSTDERGDSVERYVLDERELTLYTSFATYVVLNAKEEGCKNVSPHCLRCPHGRTYCTNAAQLLAAPDQRP